jgi:ABC-type dipeptide/oligopeptide/nickel transport system permease component
LLAYILKRLGLAVPALIGVSLLVFAMSHLVPGDPVAIMLGERATAADMARLRAQLGLDQPLYIQYADFVSRAVRGDLGTSIRTGRPVLQEISEQFPSTLVLTLAAVVLAAVAGVVAGTVSATSSHKLVGGAVMIVVMLGISTPTFFSGMLLIIVFSLYLNWLPVATGAGLAPLVLPSIALAAPAAAVLARVTRSTMLEELRKDYVRTAHAKGLQHVTVVVRHVWKNAMIPIVTILGLQFGGLMAGAVIVESVFARPGLGRYTVNAINARDFPQIQGTVLVVAVAYLAVNLLVDVLYASLDPRIKYQ